MPTNPEFIATRIHGMKVEAAASELLRYNNMTIRNTLEALESMHRPRTLSTSPRNIARREKRHEVERWAEEYRRMKQGK